MHACGHDGHMAMLLDLAAWLDRQETLPHNVLLLFQPAEETTGGARDLCQSGVFEAHKVQCVFGMHLWPDVPAGVVASRKNELMSRSCEVSVTITGRSSHIAKAEEGIDAMAAGVEFYRRAVSLEQALPPQVFRLLKFGRMESGTVRNAVSGKTLLLGSLRAFQDEIFFSLRDGLVKIGQDIANETGCAVDVHTNDGYPAVMNPDDLYDRVRSCGLDFQELEKPVMITEDFSWYQRHLPGMFFFLGTGPSPALHADDFHFDESVLSVGAQFWKDLAKNFQ
jgi:hippurate hydrolase